MNSMTRLYTCTVQPDYVVPSLVPFLRCNMFGGDIFGPQHQHCRCLHISHRFRFDIVNLVNRRDAAKCDNPLFTGFIVFSIQFKPFGKHSISTCQNVVCCAVFDVNMAGTNTLCVLCAGKTRFKSIHLRVCTVCIGTAYISLSKTHKMYGCDSNGCFWCAVVTTDAAAAATVL